MSSIKRACHFIETGGVIAYPTEAVFGLGCHPLNSDALNRLLDIKGRDAHKGFIVVCSSVSQLDTYIQPLTASLQQRLEKDWPGPVTWIVPSSSSLPAQLTGHRDTIAVRVSDHPVVRVLCDTLGHPLVSSSANMSGQPALVTADEVRAVFEDLIDYVVDAPVGERSSPSAIFDGRTMERVR